MLHLNTRPKVVLLDMDGVVIRHPTVFKILTNRVNSFVRQKVNPHMSMDKASKINEVLYTEFGHTVIGLQKVYDSNITNKDFCDMVYNKPFLDYVDILDQDPEFLEQALDFQKFVAACNKQEIPVYIFSNANYTWCRSILDMMKISSMKDNSIISCDSEAYTDVKNEVCLKPNKITYMKAMQHIYKTTKSRDNLEVVYVDDHIRNLIPVMHNKFWTPVWMNNSKKKYNIHSENMHTINDINQLYNFI